jgi:hypothetical protein
MRRWLAFVLAALLLAGIHEGAHALTSALYGEYATFTVRPYGAMEVIYKTPVEERHGAHWAVMSGTSNLLTLALGYALLALSERLARLRVALIRGWVYYLTMLALLADALNLSLGPFLYGGDAEGIALGLGVSHYAIQGVFLVVLLLNRELVAQKLLPQYGVQTSSLFLRPWIRRAA